MGKERKAEVRTVVVRQSPAVVVIACACCLGAGLAVGYYFGSRSAPVETATSAPQADVPNPAAFMQNEATLKSILASNPKDLTALIRLGDLYYDNSRHAEAITWYGRALELDPNNPNVRTDRGTSYYSIGQPDAALAEFRKSLEIAPNHAQTLYNMGVVYLHGKNDPIQARKAWETLLARVPDYPDRAKVQDQIAGLSAAPAEAPAAKGAAATDAEELLERLRKK